MKWTFKNYEADMKDLDPQVRQKALKIANRLMEQEDYTKEEALKEAVKEAQEWFIDKQG